MWKHHDGGRTGAHRRTPVSLARLVRISHFMTTFFLFLFLCLAFFFCFLFFVYFSSFSFFLFLYPLSFGFYSSLLILFPSPLHFRCILRGRDCLYVWSDAAALELSNGSNGWFRFILDGKLATMYSSGSPEGAVFVVMVVAAAVVDIVFDVVVVNAPPFTLRRS